MSEITFDTPLEELEPILERAEALYQKSAREDEFARTVLALAVALGEHRRRTRPEDPTFTTEEVEVLLLHWELRQALRELKAQGLVEVFEKDGEKYFRRKV